MKKHFLVITLLFICILTTHAQDIKEMKDNNINNTHKFIIGVQFNPFIDEHLFDSTINRNVFAFRAGYYFNKNISAGAEFSGYFGKAPYTKLHQFNYGVFFRYSFFPDFYISPFVELSPYYSHFYQYAQSPTYHGKIMDDFFNWYVAPGVSAHLFKKIISFDLFYKFSSKEFVNNKKSVITYRICVHF